MSTKLRTYATVPEVRRMRKLRQTLGVSQGTIADALHTPLRTWQTWEALADRDSEAGAGYRCRMHRVIWERAMELLEARQARPEREAAAQADRAAAGLPPIDA